MIKLIHIGKCGGSFVVHNFGWEQQQYHLEKPKFKTSEHYVIWVRNPIRRFVSAFNMSHALINYDMSDLPDKLTLDNCLAPVRVNFKRNHNYTFSPSYDALVNFSELQIT